MEIEIQQDLQMLYGSIAELIKRAKTKVAVTANAELTMLYWNIGKSIHQFVLQGNRAAYGKQIIINLSEMLTLNFGSGWSDKHLRHCLRSAETIEELCATQKHRLRNFEITTLKNRCQFFGCSMIDC